MATVTATSEEDIWDKILEKSRSHSVYKELNSDVKGNNYDSCCKIFNKSEKNEDNENYELCRKIARNTDYLYDISNTSEYSSRCSHYRHWVYENIEKIIKNTAETDKKLVASKFLDVRNCIMLTYRAYNCLFDFKLDELSKLDNKLGEKHLYDYFNNFDTIKTDKTCEHVQMDKYKKYLTHISNIYEKHNNEYHCCNGSWQENCFSYFKCDDNLNPHKLLFKLENEANGNCKYLEKKTLFLASDSTASSQIGEQDIMSTFYTGPCKDIGEGRLICNLRQASYISPKVPHKPLKYMSDVKYNKIKMNLPPYAKPSNVTVPSQDNNPKLHSINTGSMVSNLKTDERLKAKPGKDERPHSLNPVIPNIQNEHLPTIEFKEGFKWKFGEGTLSCSTEKSKEDTHNLCGYLRELKKKHKYIKNSYQGNADVINNLLSKSENIYNVNTIEKTDQRDITMDSNSDAITHMFSNMYSPSNALHEEHILNSTYIRVSMVAALILGIIFLFLIYYKVNEINFKTHIQPVLFSNL
ncbi:hypothetical protein PVMG_02269 [Plasmodium vivax Mauritania I]|uniref:Uncharacterized protein n=1 Tax=Plasmodium vivax Mauritania I TaxID=1035515 RepID=A0A0J9W1P9_PLAVI|nr:hypothetical protein PVMG_02269 [Plasmodium vivax Mauritania I]